MNTTYYISKSAVLILILLKTAVAYEKLQPCISLEILRNISFLFYKGPTVNNFITIPYEDALSIAEISKFNSNKKTVFYLHGWTETPSKNIESVDTIAKAFLAKKSVNLVVVDYSELVQGESSYHYLKAVLRITNIGKCLGYFLKKYIPNIQPVEKVHLIGHSLGGQVMSKTAIAYGKGRLKWLTALDPAGPFFKVPMVNHLTKDDAQFLDVIHTDCGEFGDGRSIGHIDFFPNMGVRIQPYCKGNQDEYCSHKLSWRYYAESIVNKTSFPAKKCKLHFYCTRFNMEWCCREDAVITNMGYGVNKKLRGDFYLKTDKKSPFSLGKEGFYV